MLTMPQQRPASDKNDRGSRSLPIKVKNGYRRALFWVCSALHFRRVRVNGVALLKMAMHAQSGGELEVMGMLIGYPRGEEIVVSDCFALPVEGTETRVNAGEQANTYMVEYVTALREMGRAAGVVGWYHSHPGYGCWLSRIDVETECLYQRYQDPFVAIVVDPVRTAAAGRVEIGAFRTFPDGFRPSEQLMRKHQIVPMDKIEDFGAHLDRYYPLEVSCFKSVLDTKMLDVLWHEHWSATLCAVPLRANEGFVRRQLADLGKRMARVPHDKRVGSEELADAGYRGPLSGCGALGQKIADERIASMAHDRMQKAVFKFT